MHKQSDSFIDQNVNDLVKGDEYYWVWFLLFRSKGLIERLRDRELQEAVGISMAMAGVLLFTHILGEKATITEISRWLFKRPNNISQIVSRMEKQGLVNKIKSSEGRKRVIIILTDKGRQSFDYSLKRIAIKQVMSALSKDEQKQLAIYLEKIILRCVEQGASDFKRLLLPW
ncbi:hypothetical protein ES708_03813 [subsurface metagenome]